LVVADKRLGCVAYAEDEDFSNDAVISVVYANGPSVIDQMSGLLLEEHKTGVIEARGGKIQAEVTGTVKQDGSGDVFEGFVGRERNPVRTA
jgi:hypothetical protein